MKGIEQPPAFHPEGDVFQHTLLMLEHMQSPTPTLALGVLLHDVGKPPTQTFEDRIRFNNHGKVGARIVNAICARLKLPRALAERVEWYVAQHMRVDTIPDMRESKRKRFVREEGFDELLELCRLDCVGSHNPTDTVDWIRDYKNNLAPEQIHPAPLLNGRDLIALGYTPGPLFAEILRDIEDNQLEGVLQSPEEAKAFAIKNWPLHS